jgi:hypothetical protein
MRRSWALAHCMVCGCHRTLKIQWRVLLKWPTRRTKYPNLFCYKTPRFRHLFCPSSGVFYCTFGTGKFHAGFYFDRFQAESGWNILTLLGNLSLADVTANTSGLLLTVQMEYCGPSYERTSFVRISETMDEIYSFRNFCPQWESVTYTYIRVQKQAYLLKYHVFVVG